MKTVVLQEPGRFALIEQERPQPGPGEALVRVRRVGVCGTDLHAYRGRQPFFTYPRVLGHELALEAVEIGENDAGLRPGDFCTVIPYLHCGTCIACRRGKTNCCTSLRVLGVHTDGGMTEYLTVPVANLIPAGGLSLDQLALVENQSIGAHAVRRAAPEPGERALVVGAGPIGLGVVQALKAAGAEVWVSDISEERLRFCLEALGAARAIDARGDVVQTLREATGGEMVTAVFDATGNPRSMHDSFSYVAHGGRLTLVGLAQADIAFHDPEFHKREITLLASRNATRADFEWVIRSIREGRMVTDPIITHRATFDETIDRFESWLDPQSGVIKAMISV